MRIGEGDHVVVLELEVQPWLVAQVLAPAAAQDDVLRVIAMPRAEDDPGAGTDLGRMVDESLLSDWRAAVDKAKAQGATIIETRRKP